MISSFGVAVGLHSLEMQVVFGSVGLSQDWRQISAWVGSCWTISRLEQVTGRLNETCGDNVVDLRVLSTSQVVMAEQMQAVLLRNCLVIKWTICFLVVVGKKSSIFAQPMNTLWEFFSCPCINSLWSIENSGCPKKGEHVLDTFNSINETVQHKVLISFSLYEDPVSSISLGFGNRWQ